MFKQTEDYYKDLIMGFGSGSVYDFGCYLVSLTNGLFEFGHEYTPRSLNQLFKDKNLWTGEFRNYIDVDRLANVLPEIFTSFKKIEPWNDMATLEKYLSGDYIVLGKVDARGIGGSGTHFVLITDTDGENAVVFDPWTGEHQPVANRYGKYGNILGLRIFGVKRKSPSLPITPPPMPENPSKLLDHIGVKTQEEGIAVWDREMAFLKDAREKATELKSSLDGANARANELEEKHQDFVDKVANKVGSISDEARIFESIEMFLSTEDQKNEKIRSLESAYSKLESEKKVEIDELKRSIQKLEQRNIDLLDQVEEQSIHIGRLGQRITELEIEKKSESGFVHLLRDLFDYLKKGKS